MSLGGAGGTPCAVSGVDGVCGHDFSFSSVSALRSRLTCERSDGTFLGGFARQRDRRDLMRWHRAAFAR